MVHVIVTGSRTLAGDSSIGHIEASLIKDVLDAKRAYIESITHGMCIGADTVADAWAGENNVTVHEFPADWSQGRKAGPLRNRHMIRETIKRYKANNIVVLAFTDKPLEQSKGTSGCLEYAGKQGLATHWFWIDASNEANPQITMEF